MLLAGRATILPRLSVATGVGVLAFALLRAIAALVVPWTVAVAAVTIASMSVFRAVTPL
jgi:hypothetical protein